MIGLLLKLIGGKFGLPLIIGTGLAFAAALGVGAWLWVDRDLKAAERDLAVQQRDIALAASERNLRALHEAQASAERNEALLRRGHAAALRQTRVESERLGRLRALQAQGIDAVLPAEIIEVLQ